VLRWMRVVIALCLTLGLGGSALFGFSVFTPAACLVVLGVAYGWPRLTDSPQPRSTSIMLALFGLAAIGTTWVSEASPHLEWLPTLAGIGLLWTFVQNLARGMGASHAVANVSAQVAGLVISLSAAAWVAAYRLPSDNGTVLAGLVAVVLALAATALPLPARFTSPLAMAVGVAGALGASLAVGDFDLGLVAAGVLGLIMGLLAAAVDRLLGLVADSRYQAAQLASARGTEKARHFAVQLTLGAAPIALGGVVVYVLTRILGAG
jgi:hypothetical protein